MIFISEPRFADPALAGLRGHGPSLPPARAASPGRLRTGDVVAWRQLDIRPEERELPSGRRAGRGHPWIPRPASPSSGPPAAYRRLKPSRRRASHTPCEPVASTATRRGTPAGWLPGRRRNSPRRKMRLQPAVLADVPQRPSVQSDAPGIWEPRLDRLGAEEDAAIGGDHVLERPQSRRWSSQWWKQL